MHLIVLEFSEVNGRINSIISILKSLVIPAI